MSGYFKTIFGIKSVSPRSNNNFLFDQIIFLTLLFLSTIYMFNLTSNVLIFQVNVTILIRLFVNL